jgi:ribosomal protein S18 acetylase RimI-like enzyme
MLKLATLDDVPLLENIGRETYRQHFSGIWSTKGLSQYLDTHFSRPILREQVKSSFIQYFFPVYQREPAGLMKTKTDSRIPVTPFDNGFELEKIYLLTRFTGKGIGTTALAECVSMAKDKSEKFVWLDVLKSNNKARKLYEAFGFSVVGEIPFSTDTQRIDMWVLRLDL